MTEVDIRRPAEVLRGPIPQAAVAPPEPRDPLAGWLEAANDANQLAHQLVRSYFVPEAFKPRGGPDGLEVAVSNATGAILMGRSLGLDPLTSLQQIYVVHGRPGMYAKLKVALTQAAGHRVWDEEYSAERAVVCGQRKGTEDVVRIEITFQQADDAGWTSNPAYKKTPADMLWARAASRVVDRIAADLLMGIRSIEDIDPDDQPVTAAATDLSAAPKAIAAAVLAAAAPAPGPVVAPAGQAAPAPEQTAPPAAAPAPAVEVAVLPAPRALIDVLKGLFDGHGIGGRSNFEKQARLDVLQRVTGRPATSTDLTEPEARLVRDNLMGAAGRRLVSEVTGVPFQPADPEAPAADADAPPAEPEGWEPQ